MNVLFGVFLFLVSVYSFFYWAVIKKILKKTKSILTRKRENLEPPLVSGHPLWGSSQEFGKNAVQFLQKNRDQHGDFFTVRMLHQHMTFILDPCSVDSLKNKNFDFDPIQRQVTNNVFGFELKNPKRTMTHIAHTSTGAHMEQFIYSFDTILHNSLDNCDAKKQPNWSGSLRQFCGDTVFAALFGSIFGTEHHRSFNSKNLFHNFEVFHEVFNFLWLGFPVWMFSSASKALTEMLDQPTGPELVKRKDVSDYIKEVVENMAEDGQTEGDLKGHNLLYLHVNYNTLRLSYWIIYYLLKHPEALKACSEEVKQLIGGDVTSADVPYQKLESLQVLESCVKEASRLTSGVFVVREVLQDTVITSAEGKQYKIRGGDKVVYYPPAVHTDKEIFDEPEVFRFDRFVDATFERQGRPIKHPTLGFGTICPGKRMALVELKWFVCVLLTGWKMSLVPGMDTTKVDISCYGHEILPPTDDVHIKLEKRENAPNLRLV